MAENEFEDTLNDNILENAKAFYQNTGGSLNGPEMYQIARSGQKSQESNQTYADLSRTGGKDMFATKRTVKLF